MAVPDRHADVSTEALELVAARFKVLAEPLRLQLLQLLRGGEKNVSELTRLLGATQPNVSKHLRVLQDAGLVGRRQAGNSVFCFVADPSVFELCDVVCNALYDRVTAHARLLEPSTGGTSRPRRRGTPSGASGAGVP